MADPGPLIEPLIPALRRYAYALLREHAAADDLVQDTLERALKHWLSRRADGDLRAWLFTILHNTALNRFRDRSRQPLVYDSDTVDRAADASSNLRDARFAEDRKSTRLNSSH